MQIEHVQRWVQTGLLVTTAVIFAGGLALLAGSVADKGGAKPGLLIISAIVGVLAMAGARLIHQRSVLSPVLLLGLVPAAIGWYFVIGF